MISEVEISAQCHPRTLQRARLIAASDRTILSKQCHYDESETIIRAHVVGSEGWNDRYRTSVVFDEDNDYILDYSCTCAAYSSYEGMCKHCAALLLAYNEAPAKFIGYQEQRTLATSSSIAAFMERSKQLARAEDTGMIDLETTITYGYDAWSAHFKIIGPQGAYVMKSIADFVRNVRKNEHVSYGKKLGFTHSYSSFTDGGSAIAQFLERAVSVREQVGSASLWSRRGRQDAGRELDLSDSELIELLDLLDGKTFTVQGTDYGTRAVSKARIEHTDPQIALRIEKVGDDGYAIMRSEEIPLVALGNRMYVWLGDTFYRCSPAFAQNADFLRTVYESTDDRLFISTADMPLFCATALPTIEEYLQVHAPHEIDRFRLVPCKLEFYFDKTDRGVVCEARAVYGETSYTLFESEGASGRAVGVGGVIGTVGTTSGIGATNAIEPDDATDPLAPAPLRDDYQESKGKRLVERYFPKGTPTIPLNDDEAIARLLFGGLIEFKQLGSVFTTPAIDRMLTDRKPRVSFGLSLAGDLINLTVSSEDLPARELSALLASYRKKKRYHRLRNGAFVTLEDLNLSQLDRLVSDLRITSKQLTAGVVELPSFRAFYLDEELEDARRDETFTRYLDDFKDIAARRYPLPQPLKHTLRSYQAEGFQWLNLLVDRKFGGILADEMGLGKSIQLIALLLARRAEARKIGPSLIACPASLVYNWLAEFEKFAPELNVVAITGTKLERARLRMKTCDVMITSYDLLRIDSDDYEKRDFYCFALDEAQYIKNHATLTTRSVKRVSARHRLALTGTPMENRLSELWSIFDFLMPGLLGSYMRFRENFELALMGGDEDAARRLQALTGPFMLRRLKADVLSDLPDKLESVVYAQMEDQQRQLYAASEQQLRDSLTEQKNSRKNRGFDERKVEILAELTKLRQLCCDPHLLYENYSGGAAKLDTIMELLESASDAGEKTLVFSQFTSFLSVIAAKLDEMGVPYYTLTGSTPKKKRLDLVNAFNEDDTPVFLMSLKAGGTGLNLIGASVVIHADPWWNAAAQTQATDRAHRIGQTQVVSVHKVIAKDTIEERILKLQESKTDLAERIIGGDSISLASLTKDDLIDLLQA